MIRFTDFYARVTPQRCPACGLSKTCEVCGDDIGTNVCADCDPEFWSQGKLLFAVGIGIGGIIAGLLAHFFGK